MHLTPTQTLTNACTRAGHAVYAAVAAATKVDEKFFERWFAEFSDFPVTLSGEDIKAIEILWAEAMKLGLLKSVPPVKETIWAKVLTQ